MEINSLSAKPVSFKGYDARPLKALVFSMPLNSDTSLFKEVKKIGDKDGFDVYCVSKHNMSNNADRIELFCRKNEADSQLTFMQDVVQLFPNGKLSCWYESLGRLFERQFDNVKESTNLPDRAGGNMYFLGKGKNTELLIGKDDICEKPYMIDYYKKYFGVKNLYPVPQADFHLDMFVRPLKDKKILVCDDGLILKELERAVKNIDTCMAESSSEMQTRLESVKKKLTSLKDDFAKDIKINNYAPMDEVEKTLTDRGFEPIKVPGRIYFNINPYSNGIGIRHKMNYANAIVHEKKDGSLTYITNKSKLNEYCGITKDIAEKIDFDFESMFIKYLEPYIKKEDIYFVNGGKKPVSDFLTNNNGGIHCLACEIPQKN